MIIDCHGHYTTAPAALKAWRARQTEAYAAGKVLTPDFHISDDEIRESLEPNQLRIQRERGVDLTLFSPIAGAMAHHVGDATTSANWTRACNDLIHRAVELYPDQLAAVCQLPQSPGVSPANCIGELKRCVQELGFVGCNVNPDPSDGYWTDPPLTQKHWYPLFETLVELDVPAMVHVSCSCNPNFHHTGAHYLNGDTTAFMQFLMADIFKDFPTLRFVIPHGGGAVPFHWGRYRGLAQQFERPTVEELMNNVFFDTCVYHRPGIELLLEVVPPDNVLFASEIIGAVKGIDPRTGYYYDDTKRYIDAVEWLQPGHRAKVLGENALRVYPRLAQRLQAQGRL
ncbi:MULTISPECIES: amidohydrolase family protein [unclassified Achromobacter]|uniref:amidohydrolase family protein n=1 Tax=unclassified Achromobacter TaxID=2626865 RepID=UPI000B51E62C|nr:MULTISPECIES: amidohydrolase family protein [unclassified Achromobacter]OWT71487.1 4-oxalomesaconate hydratase [Achromobacter sp. HZ34]OWT73144.1 4-oxalomesaconate hydratase [Achromobacter sp. HZ28]